MRKKEKLLSTINKYIETFEIKTITSFYFANSRFKNIELKSWFRCGSPFFIWFLIPPRAWLLPRMQISSTNLIRAVNLRVLSFGETPELVTESRRVVLKRGRVYLLIFGVLCPLRMAISCFSLPLDHLLRFHTILKCEVAFV